MTFVIFAMRIGNLNQNFIRYNAKPAAKPENSFEQVNHSRLSYDKIPSIAFKGAHYNIINKLSLPSGLKNFDGELYKIKLFDKLESKKVNAFLGYSDAQMTSGGTYNGDKILRVFNNVGDEIGDVATNSTEWCQLQDCEEFSRGLPKPYLWLNFLASKDNYSYAGVGSALIQAAVEKSLRSEAKGRLCLFGNNCMNTGNDPFIFYNKKGFSLTLPDGKAPSLDLYIDFAMRKLRISQSEFDGLMCRHTGIRCDDANVSADDKLVAIYKTVAGEKQLRLDGFSLRFGNMMYLNDGNVQKVWKPIIDKNPIFSVTNRVI